MNTGEFVARCAADGDPEAIFLIVAMWFLPLWFLFVVVMHAVGFW